MERHGETIMRTTGRVVAPPLGHSRVRKRLARNGRVECKTDRPIAPPHADAPRRPAHVRTIRASCQRRAAAYENAFARYLRILQLPYRGFVEQSTHRCDGDTCRVHHAPLHELDRAIA